MKTVMLVLFACFLCIAAQAAPRAAFVYSSWGNHSFLREFTDGFQANQCQVERFENPRLPELTERLAEFDLVVIGSTGNYEHTVDMAPYAGKWRAYLEKGGSLVVVDANYDSVLQKFLGRLGPEFAFAQENCSSLKRKTPESKREDFNEKAPLLYFPEDLTGALAQKGHWGHLRNVPEGWDILASCVDGNPLAISRRFGKGRALVMVHSSLMGKSPLGKGIIANMRLEARLAEAGITMLECRRPAAVGKSSLELVLGAAPEKCPSISARLTGKNKKGAREYAVKADVQDGKVVLVSDLELRVRGENQLELEIFLGGRLCGGFAWNVKLPEYIEYKLKRKHFYPSSEELELNFEVHPDEGTDSDQTVLWRMDGGRWNSLSCKGPKGSLRLPAKGLSLGKHMLDMTLQAKYNGQEPDVYGIEFFKHPAPAFENRKDGVLLKEGRPFFPMGFYHVSWQQTPEHRAAMVREIAKYGYNLVHVGVLSKDKDPDYGAFLEECARHGVYVITEFGRSSEEVIPAYRDHKAVLGWNPGDEPAPKGILPEEMFARYDRFKQLDPNHIAYTVICIPAQYKNYASGTDVLSPDPYPVPNQSLDYVYWCFKSAREEAAKYGTALWVVPQCFGGYGSWKREPTGDEYRCMLYLALMAGAKGLVNYTYYDNSFYLPEHEDLWNACKSFPREVKDLIPMVLDGKFELLQEQKGGIFAGSWSMGGRRFTVVLNASPKESLPFQVKAPAAGARIVAGEAENFQSTDATLSGKLAPCRRLLVESR